MNLETKCTLTAEARNQELETRWTMTQIFFAIHSGLFAVLLIQLKEESFREEAALRFGVPVLGQVLGVVWLLTTQRSARLLAYWNEKLAELELTERVEPDVFRTDDGQVPSPPGTTMDKLLVALVTIFIVVWTAILGYFIVLDLH